MVGRKEVVDRRENEKTCFYENKIAFLLRHTSSFVFVYLMAATQDVAVVFSTPTLAFGMLSNFFDAPTRFCGVEYPTSEHAYQAQKFREPGANAGSLRAAELVRTQSTPFKAKLLASLNPPRHFQWQVDLGILAQELVHDGARLRADWEDVKVNVMRGVLRSKFRLNAACREVLMGTGTQQLIERSVRDVFWGQTTSGVGKNVLGQLLMQLRHELRVEDEVEAAAAAEVAAAEVTDLTESQ